MLCVYNSDSWGYMEWLWSPCVYVFSALGEIPPIIYNCKELTYVDFSTNPLGRYGIFGSIVCVYIYIYIFIYSVVSGCKNNLALNWDKSSVIVYVNW